jgi:hypothetical protein
MSRLKLKLKLLGVLFLMGVTLVNAQEDDYYAEDFVTYYRTHPEIGGDITLLVRITRIAVNGDFLREFKIFVHKEGSYFINFWIMCPRTVDNLYPVYDVSANDKVFGRITVNSTVWQSIGLINNETVDLKQGLNIITVNGGKAIDGMGMFPSVEFVRMSTDEEMAKIPQDYTSNDNIYAEGIAVYPNPVAINSSLNIKSDETINQIAVYDIFGRLNCTKTLSNNSGSIPLSELKINRSGMYILRIYSDKGIKSQKLIVR